MVHRHMSILWPWQLILICTLTFHITSSYELLLIVLWYMQWLCFCVHANTYSMALLQFSMGVHTQINDGGNNDYIIYYYSHIWSVFKYLSLKSVYMFSPTSSGEPMTPARGWESRASGGIDNTFSGVSRRERKISRKPGRSAATGFLCA